MVHLHVYVMLFLFLNKYTLIAFIIFDMSARQHEAHYSHLRCANYSVPLLL